MEIGQGRGWFNKNYQKHIFYSFSFTGILQSATSGQNYSGSQDILFASTPSLWFSILYEYIIKKEKIGSFTPLSNHLTNTYWAPNLPQELGAEGRKCRRMSRSSSCVPERPNELREGHELREALMRSYTQGSTKGKRWTVPWNQIPAYGVGIYFFKQCKKKNALKIREQHYLKCAFGRLPW